MHDAECLSTPTGPEKPVTLAPLSDTQVAAYLSVLGVGPASPSGAALGELVRAHLTRVPFENISKLHYRERIGLTEIPPVDLFLEGIERWHFGGTCYANNYHFCRLLQALGYEAALCGAAMSSGADVHAAITVAIEGRAWLVDGGYAAPFLRPMPRDSREDVEVKLGRDRYVLRPQDELGRSRVDMYRDGTLRHGYLLNPSPRPVEHFRDVILSSFRPSATFMNAVLLVRFTDSRSVTIDNLSLIRSSDDEVVNEIFSDRDRLVEGIEREFGIPSAIVGDVIARLGPFADTLG